MKRSCLCLSFSLGLSLCCCLCFSCLSLLDLEFGLNNELNVCYYVVGSKKELKKNKIIQTGFLRKTKIMEGDFERSYFTKADKRTLSLIALHSKKADVLSKHPAGSYQIVEDANGLKSLKITDSSRFWELSNFLIVKVG